MRYFDRIYRIRRRFKRLKADSFLVLNPSNIFYLSGFYGSDSALLITSEASYIITDFRYEQEAEEATEGFEIITGRAGFYKKAAGLIRRLSLKRTCFESGHISVKDAAVLTGLMDRKPLPVSGLVEGLRVIKDAGEVEAIKVCADIVKKVLKRIVKEVKNNKTEKEIAARIEFLLKTEGADKASFDTIVASGKNASMPHAVPTMKRIRAGEAVVMDFGARYNGYSSDLTRTLFMGKISQRLNILYSIVKAAQDRAIRRIRPGIKISEIDRAARDYIAKRGFGDCFGHATGHSIGIDVHEPPSINSGNHATLREGMVFTVEPGIYIPGTGGVRVEDMVLVTRRGCEVLT